MTVTARLITGSNHTRFEGGEPVLYHGASFGRSGSIISLDKDELVDELGIAKSHWEYGGNPFGRLEVIDGKLPKLPNTGSDTTDDRITENELLLAGKHDSRLSAKLKTKRSVDLKSLLSAERQGKARIKLVTEIEKLIESKEKRT